ncbi:MAG TPA: YfiR family protein [Terriglobales bacterium]|nr:YfiR family protein [Terriglobales bacterium]
MARRILIAACLLALAMTAAAQSPRAPEYQVKAAFLYNFAKFVEWPSPAFPGSSAPFRICVLGRDPFGDVLTNVVQGKSISGHAILSMHLQSPAEARSCHVLFLSQSDPETLKQGLDRLRGLPILTVGESADFLALGGMINFVLEEDRVRFEINLEAAERHRLKLSSKLLAVARLVNVGGGAN